MNPERFKKEWPEAYEEFEDLFYKHIRKGCDVRPKDLGCFYEMLRDKEIEEKISISREDPGTFLCWECTAMNHDYYLAILFWHPERGWSDQHEMEEVWEEEDQPVHCTWNGCKSAPQLEWTQHCKEHDEEHAASIKETKQAIQICKQEIESLIKATMEKVKAQCWARGLSHELTNMEVEDFLCHLNSKG